MMIEKYRVTLIPPAKILTGLHYNSERVSTNITGLDFSDVSLKNIKTKMRGNDVTIDRCTIERLWITTDKGERIRANRIERIDGLSLTAVPSRHDGLHPSGSNVMGCICVDTVAGHYWYVIDRWYPSEQDRLMDPIEDDDADIDIGEIIHLMWVDKIN